MPLALAYLLIYLSPRIRNLVHVKRNWGILSQEGAQDIQGSASHTRRSECHADREGCSVQDTCGPGVQSTASIFTETECLQAKPTDGKAHAGGRGAERKHRRSKDAKGGHKDRRQARIGL